MKLVLLSTEEIALLTSIVSRAMGCQLVGSTEYLAWRAATEPILKELGDAADRETFQLDRMKWLDGQHELMTIKEEEAAKAELAKGWVEAIRSRKIKLYEDAPSPDLARIQEELAAEPAATFEQPERQWEPPTIPDQEAPQSSEEPPRALVEDTSLATPVTSTFAARLINTRQELRLSQRQVGLLVGVKQETISFWERGKASPTDEQFDLLWERLDAMRQEQAAPAQVNPYKVPSTFEPVVSPVDEPISMEEARPPVPERVVRIGRPEPPKTKVLGMHLRAWREERGLSTKDVAAILGVGVPEVGRYEVTPLQSEQICSDAWSKLNAWDAAQKEAA